MIIPSFFYGRHSEVRIRTERLVEKARLGKSFSESLPDRRVIDSFTMTAGYLTLMTYNDLSITQSHFHFTLLRAAVTKAEGMSDNPLADRLFGEILEMEWGPLVFADPGDAWIGSNFLMDNSVRRRAYLKAVLAFMRPLDREGSRYISQNGRLGTFWQANGALRQALRDEGLSAAALEKGLTPDLFRKFCREIGL